jgi:hypothetical protein
VGESGYLLGVLGKKQRDAIAERVGRNDAAFREANEGIRDAARSMELDDNLLIPFICECADVECTEIVKLSGDEYEAVRTDPTHFLNARNHQVNAKGWARVVDEFDRYTIVEKVEDAAQVAVELDPRQEESA